MQRSFLWRLLAVTLLLLIAADPISAKPRHRGARRRSSAEARLPEPRSLAEALEQAVRRVPAKANGVSISVGDLGNGEVIFERNPEMPETIASITKLFTTAAALHFLGPDYKFRTTFWRRGEIKDGTLTGPLLVVGGGDPNISGRFYNDDFNAVFDRWAQGLVQAGVKQVVGDLILNTSFFDSVERHPEWPSGQEAKWYQAPISALAFNDNVVLVSIRPGVRPGKPAAVSIDPPTGVLHTLSSARTVSRRGAVRVAVRRSAGSDNVTVSGTVPARPVWWSTPIAVDSAPEFFGAALKTRLKNAGIQMTGSVVEKPIQPDASWLLIAQTESDILPTLAVVNKHSQGFYAEQVFKTMAAEKMGQGTWANGVALVKQFLVGLGLDPARYDLRDGSGLSPYNRVGAADLVRFLQAMNRHPRGEEWKATLAMSGESEGTLRHRLRGADVKGRILAKTGTISGVSTLAGFVTCDSGKTYAFAILLNGRTVWQAGGHAFQDKLLRSLIKFG
ncbi:MAG: D-alanyl-D-alanine carboxypeptidase/D-alanyl-D-alanine-endopeptidase [Acidobacteriota bacterium]|nr:D-alanyl-D-alanine carboxypeptidase/D-alanyl-D-alanine-endopeptidase [Acidobacteriota bacterium]